MNVQAQAPELSPDATEPRLWRCLLFDECSFAPTYDLSAAVAHLVETGHGYTADNAHADLLERLTDVEDQLAAAWEHLAGAPHYCNCDHSP